MSVRRCGLIRHGEYGGPSIVTEQLSETTARVAHYGSTNMVPPIRNLDTTKAFAVFLAEILQHGAALRGVCRSKKSVQPVPFGLRAVDFVPKASRHSLAKGTTAQGWR